MDVALGLLAPNPDFSAEPDSRPWSERNASVLWVPLAVAVLGVDGAPISSLPLPQPESKLRRNDRAALTSNQTAAAQSIAMPEQSSKASRTY